MRTPSRIPACLAGASLAALLLAGNAAASDTAHALLRDGSGTKIGKATLTQTANGVLIHARATGVSPGAHAFHIHETGRCDADQGFKSAGGHFALERAHGFKSESGPHPGDMPNVHVQDDGVFEVEFLNPHVSLTEAADGYLFDADGSAFVIHAGADDYQSQPAGDAGDRIACGVIERR